MNISFYKLFTLVSVFSTKIAASELPSSGIVIKSDSNLCSRFTQDFFRKKSCVGTYTGEEDPTALCKIRGAECLLCLGIGCCAATGYGAIAYAATDPVSAFILGSISGCGASMALTMATNNNDSCSITGQHSSSTNAAEDRTRFFKAFPELRQLVQQQMSIAPSPIELNELKTNPMLK